MSIPRPGRDQVMLTAPDRARLCNSLACARAGQVAEVIVTYGLLSEPGSPPYHVHGALSREQWGRSYPMRGARGEQSRRVAARYRPALVIIDTTPDRPAPAAPQPSGGRA